MQGTSARTNRELLADRNFGPYFLGNFASNCGAWIHNVTAAIVVFDLTGSATWTGAVTAALWIGSMLIQPYAGALSDRHDRRKLMLVGQSIALSSALGLTLLCLLEGGADQLPGPLPVVFATAGIGIGVAISMPAMQAMVPALVPRADLDHAIALNAATFLSARAIGPALAAGLLLVADPTLAFALNTGSYLALIVALRVIRPRPFEPDPSAAGRGVWEGVRYVRRHRRALILLLGSAAVGFASDPVNTLTPIRADELGGGESLVGAMVSAFGIGAAIASLCSRPLRARWPQSRLGVGGGCVLALGLWAFALAPTPPLAVAAMALAGSGFMLVVTSHNTRLQRDVPEHLRGRVMALWGLAFLGTRPIVSPIDGRIADLVSGSAAAALFGGFALLAAYAAHRATAHPRAREPGPAPA